MAKHRSYSSDVGIPNLDAMSKGELEQYAAEAHQKAASASSPARDWYNLASRYARYKAKAMGLRTVGNIDLARRYELEADASYAMIPSRMRW